MRLAVHARGTGPRSYAHPGGPGLSSSELKLEETGLEQLFEIAYIDPRGTGGSARPPDTQAYALDDYVADLAETIDEPAYLLGFSHGGLVAQRFAGRYPDRVKGLALASTAARFSADVDAALQRKIASSVNQPWLEDALAALKQEQEGAYAGDAELGRVLAREMPLYFHRFDDRAKAWVDSIAADLCNADALQFFNAQEFLSIDLRDELHDIRARTIIVSGQDDFICPPDAGEDLRAGIAGAELIVIPEAGHMTFVEQPKRFYEAVSAVLK